MIRKLPRQRTRTASSGLREVQRRIDRDPELDNASVPFEPATRSRKRLPRNSRLFRVDEPGVSLGRFDAFDADPAADEPSDAFVPPVGPPGTVAAGWSGTRGRGAHVRPFRCLGWMVDLLALACILFHRRDFA